MEHGSIQPEHYGKQCGRLQCNGDQRCGLYVAEQFDVGGGECLAGGHCKYEWYYDVLLGRQCGVECPCRLHVPMEHGRYDAEYNRYFFRILPGNGDECEWLFNDKCIYARTSRNY